MKKKEEVTSLMGDYREIITKAVVARGRKQFKSSYSVTSKQTPLKILGCWVVNHEFNAKKFSELVEVNGCFDVNIWYSYHDDGDTKTGVLTERIDYCDKITLNYVDKQCIDTKKVIAKAIQQPNCLEAVLEENNINVLVERELYVEVIGETKICVKVNSNQCSETEDNYALEIHDEELANLNTEILGDTPKG